PFRSSRLIGAERQPTSDCRQSLQQSPQFHFSEPFLEEFYLNVMDQINSVGADISKIESRSFCERYAFVKGNELAVIEFWYNKSSQFTKVQPMPQLSNSTRLIDEIICQIGVLL
ncbi:hypothetical protein JNS00_26860, partial [Klebsiella pneumoniae]|nr:hypothetical protein [Klebsiella pneumoniae]